MVSKIRRLAGKLARRLAEPGSPTADDSSPSSASEASHGSRPRVLEFQQDRAVTRLLISAVNERSGDLVMLLVGRKSKLETSVPLSPDTRGWSAAVKLGDLDLFGSETVDLLVGSSDGSRQRQRLMAAELTLPPTLRLPRRFYITGDGNLSVRIQSEVELISESGVFDAEFYRDHAPDLPADVDPIEHYVARGAADGLNPSEMFDTSYYRRLNPTVRRRNPLAHYCDEGWREMFNPSPRFDTWWYWAKHLDLADDSTNPLAHWQRVGRHQGLSTIPDRHPSRRLSLGHRFDPDRTVRRVCLFAAYDPEGIVDEYVLNYLTELARYADIYYLADREMPDAELAKLSRITKNAWGCRHGEYDFGSYARLVDLVGWETIEQYDELLLVNDSCYLLRPLGEVFSRMDAKSCDWWGLQATKGIYQTRHLPANQFREPIPMETVRTVLVDRFEKDYVYDFLVGSYFLVYRAPVITDPEFRRYLRSVTTEPTKRHIVKKYEIGLTRWLIQHGHSFDTYMSRLYPFHPVFTRWYFRMVDDGFPLLKRFFLSDNLYRTPGLAAWPALIAERVPDAPVRVFERNLVRVTDPVKLRQSLDIGSPAGVEDLPPPTELLSRAEFIRADVLSPKHADWWAFPVDESTGALIGNVRAVFEQVKDDPSIHKIVLTRGGADVVADGVNVEVVALDSGQGQHRLMRAGTIMIERSIDASLVHQVASELHNLIRVGRQAPLLGCPQTAPSLDDLHRMAEQEARLRAVVSSSTTDALAVTAASYPLTLHQVWRTGLPRNDFILRNEANLPVDFQADTQRLRALLGNRRLILFTSLGGFPDAGYRLPPDDLELLKTWFETNNLVLGLRRQSSDAPDAFTTRLPSLDLSAREFVHVEILYRASSALITDLSGDFVDYLLTGRPVIGFVPYTKTTCSAEKSTYDLERFCAEQICRDVRALQAALKGVLTGDSDETYNVTRNLLFDQIDDGSAARVVEKIRDLAVVRGIGKPPDERIA